MSVSVKGFFAAVKSKLSIKKVLVGLLVIVILAVAVFGFLVVKSPEYTAQKLVKAKFYGDVNTLDSLLISDYKAELLEEEDCKTEKKYFKEKSEELMYNIDSWETLSAVQKEVYKSDRKYTLGDFKHSIEIVQSREMSLSLFAQMNDKILKTLEKDENFDIMNIDDIREVSLKEKLKGEDTIIRNDVSVLMVKMDGSWKVVEYSSDQGDSWSPKAPAKAAAPAEEAPAARAGN